LIVVRDLFYTKVNENRQELKVTEETINGVLPCS